MHNPIPVEIPTEPFDSAPRLILRTTKLFLHSLPWLAAVTLSVSIPGKFAVQAILAACDVSPEGLLSYFVAYGTDLVWNAFIAAAVIYGLTVSLRTGKLPRWRTTLVEGRSLWGVMLWNDFKVEITDREHPITRGLGASYPQPNDELYANLKWQPAGTYHVLATAWDDHSLYKPGEKQPIPGPGINQPMLWTVDYGRGRVFVTALGHDADAMKSDIFALSLVRGTEWAATGTVSVH